MPPPVVIEGKMFPAERTLVGGPRRRVHPLVEHEVRLLREALGAVRTLEPLLAGVDPHVVFQKGHALET